AAVVAGFLLGRGAGGAAETAAADGTESIDAAMAPTNGPGLAALITAAEPPDASILLTALVEP
ncbi:MAG: hypothetical protein ACREMN_14080, partial [Gemmatimonadales bacterium]